jgi:hypothetical protein
MNFDPASAPWRMMSQIQELALQVSGYESQEDSPNFYKGSQVYELAPWEYSNHEWQTFKAAVIDLKVQSDRLS